MLKGRKMGGSVYVYVKSSLENLQNETIAVLDAIDITYRTIIMGNLGAYFRENDRH